MESRLLELSETARAACADRIGLARLAKLAFDGHDIRPIWRELMAKMLGDSGSAGEGLDLSLLAQLLGDKQAGLAIQREVLLAHQLYRIPCAPRAPRLRVLALPIALQWRSHAIV